MAIAANVEQFYFQIEGVEERLRVVRFSGDEGINRLYRYRIHIACEDPELDLDRLLGTPTVLRLVDEYERTERFVHGIIFEAHTLKHTGRFTHYEFFTGPYFGLLKQKQNCRIFQHQNAPDIIKSLLEENGLNSDFYRLVMQEDHPEREYCVQYQETEFDFILRLLEEEGMNFYFEHTPDNAVLVLADGTASHADIPEPEIAYHETTGMVPEEEQTVHSLYPRYQIQSGAIAMRDYNFVKPTMNLHVAKQAEHDQPLEVYYYPGGYQEAAVGEKLAQFRLDALRVQSLTHEGRSACRRFVAGFRFSLVDHPLDELNQTYVLTRVQQEGEQVPVLEEVTGGERGTRYHNRIEAIPVSLTYRTYDPDRRPVILGTQTAIVVGPEGEEIYTNEHGQVKVQFHWDREGVYNEQSSCWVRVSQQWAGTGWGTMMIPRIGQEVVVSFLNGDPDRPLIVGRVYHGTNKPPYPLPEHKTRMLLKSNSSLGGDGFNEIRIEDKKGEEQIFTHAEKDMDVRIENDTREWVGNDRHLIVVNDQLENIKGDKHLITNNEFREEVGGTISIDVGDDRQEKTAVKWAHDAGQEIHLNSSQKVVFEAGMQLTLKVGGNFVTCDPSGVSIVGSMIKINSGGAAGTGSGSSPDAPTLPMEADDDTPGKPPKEEPAQVEDYSPAAWVLVEAARTGKPFCAVCEKASK